MSKLADKVKRLFALASRAVESGSAEENEARTAAMMLFRVCRENGIRIKFEIPKEKGEEPAPAPPPQAASRYPYAPFDSTFEDLLNTMRGAVRQSAPPDKCPECGDAILLGQRVVRGMHKRCAANRGMREELARRRNHEKSSAGRQNAHISRSTLGSLAYFFRHMTWNTMSGSHKRPQ